MCGLISFTGFVWNISYFMINSAIWYHKFTQVHVSCLSFLSDLNQTSKFSTRFRKILQKLIL
jgi:hypothetical protein